MMNPFRCLLFMLVFLAGSGLDQHAYAYLDPGTGSMVLQLLLGGIAGALVVGKLYWHRFKSMFGRSASNPSTENHRDAQDSQNEK